VPSIQNQTVTGGGVRNDIELRSAGPFERDLLVEMYDKFEPLGGAFGLPPFSADSRREWIVFALSHQLNIVAFAADGAAVGHCFLVANSSGSAEMAIFVRQEYRRQGIGKALVRSALARAAAAGLRRVWSITASENRAALRLQQSCGFRVTKFEFLALELEIALQPDEACAFSTAAEYGNAAPVGKCGRPRR
jgi:GNAT superfamily N-acetyltransferase